MGGGGHGVPCGDEGHPVAQCIPDDVVALLDLRPVEDLDGFADGLLQIGDGGSDEGGCVEFSVDDVAFLQGLQGLDGHSVGAAEAETYEHEFRCHGDRILISL